jgi:two-component system, LytTR family, response regulator
MKLKAIIADDEVLAREGLRLLLSGDPDIEVVAECSNGRETIATLKEHRADVLFLDIQMPGTDGFQVIDQIGVSQMPVIVFITAHNHYAVQAFEVEALDYLTKPVETERLQQTLRRVKERVASHAAPVTQEQFHSLLASLNDGAPARSEYVKRLVVPNGAKDSFVAVNDIEWIEADSYYARLHVGPKTFMLRETIKQLANTLDPKKFVRVHRSAIVNIDHVREILREGQNKGWVVLSNGQRLKMSKPGWQSLLDASRA